MPVWHFLELLLVLKHTKLGNLKKSGHVTPPKSATVILGYTTLALFGVVTGSRDLLQKVPQ